MVGTDYVIHSIKEDRTDLYVFPLVLNSGAPRSHYPLTNSKVVYVRGETTVTVFCASIWMKSKQEKDNN